MELKGKRLLILGGANVHCKVVEAAKKLGIYTIVADYLPDSPAKRMADESLLISILDVEAIVDWCKKNPVDGVINYANDPAQKAHQQICARLGLPCYGNEAQVFTLTDKRAFKKTCAASGISVIPVYTEGDILSGSVEYPILIKPADSRGSRGQTVCHNRQEALEGLAFARSESFTGSVIIERHMAGCDDLQLAYLVANGEPALIKVEDRYLGSRGNNLDRLCVATVCPSRHEKAYREKVNDRVIAMIRQIGIQNGPVFLQGFWDGEDVLFYDPGIRLPGDNFDYAYTEATGICIPELLVRYALTGIMPGDTAEKISAARIGKATAMVLPCLRPGRIAAVEGLDEIRNMSGVLSLSVEYGVGDTVDAWGSVRQRFAEFLLCCNSFDELSQRIDALFHILRVTDAEGRNMLIEQFDPNLLQRGGYDPVFFQVSEKQAQRR